MKAKATAIFSGPSIYAQHPVVRFSLRGFVPLPAGSNAPDILEDLCSLLPELGAPSASCGAPGCLATAPTGEPVVLGHLFEHICLVLQNRVGAELACTRTSPSGPADSTSAVVPYEEADVCIEAARLACDLLASLAAQPGASETGTRALDFPARWDKFSRFAATSMLPIQDRTLVRTARRLGIPAVRVVGRTIVLGNGRFQQRVSGTKTSFTNVVGNDLAANKDYARRVLGEFGLPVPRYERVYRRRQAVEAARRIGYPVVVKPNDGSMGRAVSVRMTNRREVSAAYRRARAVSRSVLVEELVEGDDYRLLVINGKLCAATRRIPGRVVGDGEHTIEDLVGEVNRDPRRAPGHTSSWTRIEMDGQSDRLLGERGYTRQSIPPAGEIVYLRRIANSSAGGTSADVTDDVHPDNREIAVCAAKAIGLDIAGVDILTRDISSSLWQSGGKINEINSKPGLRKHLWPATGEPRDVITPILGMLFPAGSSSRVPVVGIVGTGSTRIVAQMLAHVLAAAGRHVGLVTGGSVSSKGRKPRDGELAPAAAVRRVLLDPAVDVAVLEIAPDDVVRYGLGCDRLDVAVIVNGGSGKGGSPGVPRDSIEALRLVARRTCDVVYVAEATGLSATIGTACDGAGICPVALEGPGDGLAATGAAVEGRRAVLRGDSLAIHANGRRRQLLRLAGLPGRVPGLDAGGIVECAAYATVAALSLGEAPGDILKGLSSFRASPKPRSGNRKGKAAGKG